MKKQKPVFKEPDLSRWHILTYDEMLKVNGGSGSDSDDDDSSESQSSGSSSSDNSSNSTETASESTATATSESTSTTESSVTSESTSTTNSNSESSTGSHIENSNEAVANSQPGDTLTRSDGTEVTITQGDINWAQEHCAQQGKDGDGKESGEEIAAGGNAVETAEASPNVSEGHADEGREESRTVENTIEAVANASPGDKVVRSDGTEATITQGDITWAQERCDERGISYGSKDDGRSEGGKTSGDGEEKGSGTANATSASTEKAEDKGAESEKHDITFSKSAFSHTTTPSFPGLKTAERNPLSIEYGAAPLDSEALEKMGLCDAGKSNGVEYIDLLDKTGNREKNPIVEAVIPIIDFMNAPYREAKLGDGVTFRYNVDFDFSFSRSEKSSFISFDFGDSPFSQNTLSTPFGTLKGGISSIFLGIEIKY